MGRRMERRGIHVDAAIFYEWAKLQYTSRRMKNIQDIRWVACKRKQAGRDGIDSQHWLQASERLAKLGLDSNLDIPDYPFMSFSQWAELIQTILAIKDEIKKTEPQQASSITEGLSDSTPERKTSAVNESNPVSVNLPVIVIDGYEMVLRPKKNDVRIEYVDELISVCIGNGRIPKDTEDFFIENDRLYRRDGDNNVATPFKIITYNGKIRIIIEK